MATNRMVIDGFGQVELNNAAFRRDGRIEAQCRPDLTTSFSANDKIENGMILAVDALNHLLHLPTNASSLPMALVYSAEHLYDERATGLKDFALNASDDFLPRLGYLAKGDKFTTNCVEYDTSEFATAVAFDSALSAIQSTALYGEVDAATGIIAVTASVSQSPVGPTFRVIEYTTMPDGQKAVKLQVMSE